MECYLDNAATTKPCREAIEAAMNVMVQGYGNPSSLHRRGFLAEGQMHNARESIASLIGVEARELIFTSGATESNNLAIIGSAMALKRRGNRIITTTIEHPSVLAAMEYLETNGFEVVRLDPIDGRYTPEQFYNAVDEKTILISAMMVNNEMGLILPVFEIAEAVKRKKSDIICHCDAVQGFLKLPFKVKNSSIDLMSFSGHKVYAPMGIGGLYIKRGVRLIKQSYGGSQQNCLRAGTESVPLIAALGAAVKAKQGQREENHAKFVELNRYLRDCLHGIDDVTINSGQEGYAPYIINLSVKGIRSEIMLHFLEEQEIYVSSGSACSKGKYNYVLSAMGLPKEQIDSAIRISVSCETTKQELDCFVQQLKHGIETLAKR